MAGYLRVAALGDSATVGVGDPTPHGWRGWVDHLLVALRTSYDVSCCNTATIGATTVEVRRDQLDEAVTHRPDLASLVVGVNDTLRSTWCPDRVREDLLACADALVGGGATLMTVRLHDHPALVPALPGWARRALSRRVAQVNDAFDEVTRTYGGLVVDLRKHPSIGDRACWSVDRLHPSEVGHRLLAAAWADALAGAGYDVAPPSLEQSGGLVGSRARDLAWIATEVAPWAGRRARDLGPWALRAGRPAQRTPPARSNHHGLV